MDIPKILHHIWIGDPMPEHLQANCLTWFDILGPRGWDFKLWTESEIDELSLQNRALYDKAEAIVPRDAVEQFRADIVRYEILHFFGGFYADVDTVPLKNIEPALEGHHEFAAREDRNWVGNTYLAAVPGHPIMHALIAEMPRNVHRFQGNRPNKLSGPQYLTPIWNRHHGHVAPRDQWFPYSYVDVKRGTVPGDFGPDVFAVHEWSHTQRVLAARSSAIRPRRQALQARVPFGRI